MFTYYMDTANSDNDEGLEIAPTLSFIDPLFWDFDSSSNAYGWLACGTTTGDLYAFYIDNRTKAPEAEHAHKFQNSATLPPNSVSVVYEGSDEVYIFVLVDADYGQTPEDRIKIIHLDDARYSSTVVQKEILTNSKLWISAFVHYDSIVIGSTRGYMPGTPGAYSAQVIKLDKDYSTTSHTPGAYTVGPLSSYTYSNVNSSLTNVVLADMTYIRPNVYHSSLTNLNYLDASKAVKTDELKLTEDGFQTIQPPSFNFNSSYSYGASASSSTKYLSYNVQQCQKVDWEISEAKVGGVDVPWVTTQTPNTFLIDPSLATGAGDCCGIQHTLNLKFKLDTPGMY